jgi:uncharacterized protein YegL
VKYPRDIVFVIDVSGSMSETGQGKPNDGLKNGTCGRKSAIESIISGITSQGGDTRFGVVTFSSEQGFNNESSALFADRVNLFADIGTAGNSSQIICAAKGGTKYKSGFDRARDLLSIGRRGALKEIYFVSDGAPEDGVEATQVADELREIGVSVGGKSHLVQIATIMLGSADASKLKTMASVDKAGVALHAESVNAKDLAATINKLSANEIDDGFIKYRSIGSDVWTEIRLRENMIGYDFTIPTFKLKSSEAPNGLEVRFEYHDQHNNIYESGGNIKWKATTKTK